MYILIQSYNFYSLIGVFRPFMFNSINNIVGVVYSLGNLRICYFSLPSFYLFNALPLKNWTICLSGQYIQTLVGALAGDLGCIKINKMV